METSEIIAIIDQKIEELGSELLKIIAFGENLTPTADQLSMSDEMSRLQSAKKFLGGGYGTRKV